MIQYTVKSAIKALGLKNKAELAKLADCHQQTLYTIKDGPLPSRLNVVVNLLLEVKNLKKVVENKDAVIAELKK